MAREGHPRSGRVDTKIEGGLISAWVVPNKANNEGRVVQDVDLTRRRLLYAVMVTG